MKHSTLKLSMLAAIGLTVTQANALGLVALPDTGFTSSAYTNCYNAGRVIPPSTADEVKGNFGSYPIASAHLPSPTKNNTCFIAKPADITTSPIAGYTLVGYRSSMIPRSTGGGGNIGTILDLVWRDDATSSMCLFGTQIASMINADHDTGTSGTQYFEVNDIARGGFAASGTVNVGYTILSTTGNTLPVYRVGRTFTSVQHRALRYDTLANQAVNGTNYLDLPTKNTVTAAITGENTPIDSATNASTTLATQDAVVNSNWVDFTTSVVYADHHSSGQSFSFSSYFYIEAPCDATEPSTWVKTGAIRLRQTGQEMTTLKEITIDGYSPPGAVLP